MRPADVCGWSLLLIALAAVPATAQSHITADALLAAIQAGNAPVIVDVRTQGEYDRGHVPGAVRIPFYAIWSRADEIKTPHDKPVVVYCEHGPRAGVARAALKLAGFERVYSLDGHMSAWKSRGLPIETTAP